VQLRPCPPARAQVTVRVEPPAGTTRVGTLSDAESSCSPAYPRTVQRAEPVFRRVSVA
jgi:hypothetical protein